jgi:rhodanese-related sulfurtransferase
MKVIYTIAFGAFLTIACSNSQPTQTNTDSGNKNTSSTQNLTDTGAMFKVISAAEFGDKIKTQPGVILDVRTSGEYKKGFIKNARLLDIFSDNFDVELNKLDRNAIYYVYCASGGRSAECSEKMQTLGFKKVYDLDGGMGAWRNANMPVEMPQQ